MHFSSLEIFSGTEYRKQRLAVFILLVFLVNLIWLLLSDNGNNMSEDDGFYMLLSLELFRTLQDSFFAWVNELFTLMTVKVPLIWWLGQIFVPIGELFGSVRHGLLLMNLFIIATAMVLMYHVVLRTTKSELLAFCGALFIAASPTLTHHSSNFFREPLQQVIILYALLCVVNSKDWKLEKLIFHVLMMILLSMMTKVALFLYMVVPLAYLAYVIKGRWPERPRLSRFTKVQLVLVSGFGLLVMIYYTLNLQSLAYWFLDSLKYGPEIGYTTFGKLKFWIRTFFQMHFWTFNFHLVIYYVAFGLAIVYSLFHKSAKAIVLICLGQLCFMLTTYSLASNIDPRYVCELLPYFVICVLIGISALNIKMVKVLLLAILLVQFSFMNVYRFTGNSLKQHVRFDDYYNFEPDYGELLNIVSKTPDLNQEDLLLAFTSKSINLNNSSFRAFENKVETYTVMALESTKHHMDDQDSLSMMFSSYEDVFLVGITSTPEYVLTGSRDKTDYLFDQGLIRYQEVIKSGTFDKLYDFDWMKNNYTVWKYSNESQ